MHWQWDLERAARDVSVIRLDLVTTPTFLILLLTFNLFKSENQSLPYKFCVSLDNFHCLCKKLSRILG